MLVLANRNRPNSGINRTRCQLASYHRRLQRAGYARRYASSCNDGKKIEHALAITNARCHRLDRGDLSAHQTSRSEFPANPLPAYSPDPDNAKVVVVTGWREEELRKIIDDFIRVYERDSYPPYTIELHRQTENTYRLTFPKDVHPWLLTFLINYLAYPSDFDLTRRSIIVAGKATLSPAFTGVDTSLLGKSVVLYLPENDQDHDVVYMQVETGDTYVNSFTELRWRKVSEARLSNEVKTLAVGR